MFKTSLLLLNFCLCVYKYIVNSATGTRFTVTELVTLLYMYVVP